MRIIRSGGTPALVLLCIFAAALRAAEPAPDSAVNSLTFTLPEGVSYEPNAEREFHKFTWGGALSTNLLMLYPNPMQSSPGVVKPMADLMEVNFRDQMEANEDMDLLGTARKELEIGPFKGIELVFTIQPRSAPKMNQHIWILHHDGRIWNAQLSGFGSPQVEIARQILESARPAAETADETVAESLE